MKIVKSLHLPSKNHNMVTNGNKISELDPTATYFNRYDKSVGFDDLKID